MKCYLFLAFAMLFIIMGLIIAGMWSSLTPGVIDGPVRNSSSQSISAYPGPRTLSLLLFTAAILFQRKFGKMLVVDKTRGASK